MILWVDLGTWPTYYLNSTQMVMGYLIIFTLHYAFMPSLWSIHINMYGSEIWSNMPVFSRQIHIFLPKANIEEDTLLNYTGLTVLQHT